MTDEELCEAEDVDGGIDGRQIWARETLKTLVTEVRRLRGLIAARDARRLKRGIECDFCDAEAAEPHKPDCPAFTEDGRVR